MQVVLCSAVTKMNTSHRFKSICFSIILTCHFYRAMTTDPGAVPPDAKPLPEPPKKVHDDDNDETNSTDDNEPYSLLNVPPPRRLCRRCKTYKPERAHHCSICRRCIIKMDHHCPWVNNCVGIGNHKYFLLFVFYTFCTCMLSIALIVLRFAFCMGDRQEQRHPTDATARDALSSSSSALSIQDHHHASRHHTMHMTCLDRPAQLLTILGLLVEALLFGMFTSCMMFDQMEVIHSKLTHIDRLKGAHVGGSLQGIVEVFGITSSVATSQAHRFRLDWLSPFARVCFPPSVQDEIMGFCRRTCGGGRLGDNEDDGDEENYQYGMRHREEKEREVRGLRLDDVL
jgi:hypothetical protein